ncbi:MAG: complex I NDUFA9 subunit family protein [Sphingomonas sp.]|uniref:complex I NDUFA9 subunit family protein n=1 Tax=Sphingomonas sp. TaxID=28214 RepID=UPI003F7F762E
MKDKLVTLIGGGGFIGRYVAQELLAAGARVRVVGRDPRRAWFLKPLGGLGQTQFVAADVTRPETIARAVAGSDAVVYLAGTWGPDFQGVHVSGVRAAAEAAHETGAAGFVHLSALGADAESPSKYYASKAAGEAAAREAFPGAVVLRPSVVFGPEDKFLNRFAGMIGGAPSLFGRAVVPVLRAGARFQPVHVVDVAPAVVRALAAGEEAAGKTIEAVGPEVVTMRELLDWLAAAIGRDTDFVELPDVAGQVIALGGFLPGAPIKLDQWKMLKTDNVASGRNPTLAALGITPTPMEAVAQSWLVQYHKAGRFGLRAKAA